MKKLREKKIEEQFTAYDKELHPECNNSEYLVYRTIDTGLSREVCSFGIRQRSGNKYKWIKRKKKIEVEPVFNKILKTINP